MNHNHIRIRDPTKYLTIIITIITINHDDSLDCKLFAIFFVKRHEKNL